MELSLSVQFSSVAQSCLTLCDPMNCSTPGLPCPSPTPRVHPNSYPLSQWCHPAISSSVVPFSSCPQSHPASESFPVSQLFAWGGQSTGVSALASFLPKNTQDWSPLEWTGWISLQSKGLSQVFSNTLAADKSTFHVGPAFYYLHAYAHTAKCGCLTGRLEKVSLHDHYLQCHLRECLTGGFLCAVSHKSFVSF